MPNKIWYNIERVYIRGQHYHKSTILALFSEKVLYGDATDAKCFFQKYVLLQLLYQRWLHLLL